jgi:hypothetical protein
MLEMIRNGDQGSRRNEFRNSKKIHTKFKINITQKAKIERVGQQESIGHF